MGKKYIDADLLLENLKKQYGEDLGWQCTVNMCDVGNMIEDCIDNAPTADVQEVRHGRWQETVPTTPKSYRRICSACRGVAYMIGKYSYCPYCGAKMDE